MNATAIDWDIWRAGYDEMTFTRQQAFYNEVAREFPGQQRFDTRHLFMLLDRIGDEPSVCELGGWDGGFAEEVLSARPEITGWTNHEISSHAVADSACFDPRYTGVALRDFYWNSTHVCDLFVASHVIEHLKLRDVLATFDATECRWMYLQSPIADEGRDWQGYRGSHILEVGWGRLEHELHERGFTYLADISHPWARCFER